MKLYTALVSLTAVFSVSASCTFAETNVTTPYYKADVPASLLTPDHDESVYLGAVDMNDGFPTEETAQKAFDFLDTSRAVNLYTNGIAIASMYAMLEGNAKIGVEANRTIGVTEQLMDARAIWLTPNTTTPYIHAEVDVKNGPVVVELQTPVIGLINDAYFKYVADIGMGGPDRGQGGKYLLVGEDYEGEIPDGYYVYETNTYRHWLLMRAVSKPGESIEQTLAAFKKGFKMYLLSEAKNPPANKYINLSEIHSITVHSADAHFFDEINEVIQYEPANSGEFETIGLAASLGIKKGEPFEPDERMQGILDEAAKIANAASRSMLYRPRNPAMYIYPDRKWFSQAIQSHEFVDDNGALELDDRMAFHFYATGITPFMVSPQVGAGSVYAVATVDSEGEGLSGDKQYAVTLPGPVPAKDFWSFMVYDNQTRSILETDQKSGGVDSLRNAPKASADGSVTIYFSPNAPEEHQDNWVQTTPGKGFNIILRLYGPLEKWFDRSWKPGDLEVIGEIK
ncbi:DUF1254 domain-containing protein [Halioglobus maricola]|uniref:DUF1254 domain-containing protein n=1 Tax=Halioglobus maricola TaxID=2601894 RepID=A0A5P9NKI4_9GAMM|nr:DUF1254 domain-containing protein [Halioglobus maricola]QFU76242.1 DUF1254 domain-containing protein [Halioglobus maricola]